MPIAVGCGAGAEIMVVLLVEEVDGVLMVLLLLLMLLLLLLLLLLFGNTTATCAGPVLMFCERLRFLLVFSLLCLLEVFFLLVNERKISPK